MAEQKLNGPDIGARFKQMDGERVTQAMWRDRLGKAGKLMRFRRRLWSDKKARKEIADALFGWHRQQGLRFEVLSEGMLRLSRGSM